MYSTFHGLEVGKRAILAQQTALSTTGHNIANANTKGYTRQEAVLQATRPLAYPSAINGTQPMQLGTGVEVAQLKRIRNQFLDMQYRNEQQKLGYYEAKSSALSNIESVFNEPSDYGLDMALNQFWQSTQELAKQPDSLSARVVLLANGQAVATSLNEISIGIGKNQENLANQMQSNAIDINASLKEIAILNDQIAKVVALGNQPNDIADKRDLLLDSLSKQIGVTVTSGQNGMVDVSVDGIQLVSGIDAKEITIDPQAGGVLVDGAVVSIEGGEVKGLLDSHGYMVDGKMTGEIPSLQTKLEALAKAISDNLNTIHSSDKARNLDGVAEKLLFFVDKDDPTQPPKNAASMMLNPELANSPQRIAAALSTNRGDGANIVAMGNLQHEKIKIGDQTTTIGNYYHMILGQVGTSIQNADRFRNNADAMVQQVEMQRQSISGVSIDEEMTNMIRYQQAYNAAAKYVSAVNEMLDKLINGMV
jgi:flagellar hook-associated protein 1